MVVESDAGRPWGQCLAPVTRCERVGRLGLPHRPPGGFWGPPWARLSSTIVPPPSPPASVTGTPHARDDLPDVRLDLPPRDAGASGLVT